MEKSKEPILNGSEAINAFASSAYILSQLIIGLACVPLSNILLKASSPRAFGGAGTLHRRRQGAQNTFLPAAATTPRCCCAGSLSFRFMAEHVCMEISGRPQRTNERSSLAWYGHSGDPNALLHVRLFTRRIYDARAQIPGLGNARSPTQCALNLIVFLSF